MFFEVDFKYKKKLIHYINFYVCANLQIMVRTRGLGRALDRVIGRALWREDNHDSDDAFQQRRLTHPHVGNRKLSLLQRMLLTWMM